MPLPTNNWQMTLTLWVSTMQAKVSYCLQCRKVERRHTNTYTCRRKPHALILQQNAFHTFTGFTTCPHNLCSVSIPSTVCVYTVQVRVYTYYMGGLCVCFLCVVCVNVYLSGVVVYWKRCNVHMDVCTCEFVHTLRTCLHAQPHRHTHKATWMKYAQLKYLKNISVHR